MQPKLKVLVVDDSVLVHEQMVEALRDRGYNAYAIGNTMEFVSTYHRYKPDIVLMDVDMPGLSGTKAVQAARISKSECTVLLHSSLPEEKLRTLAEECGAHGYLSKGELNDGFFIRLRECHPKR